MIIGGVLEAGHMAATPEGRLRGRAVDGTTRTSLNSDPEPEAEAFTSWPDRHRSSSGLLDEAYGWGSNIDPGDDEAVLAWAHQYLPRVIDHCRRDVRPSRLDAGR